MLNELFPHECALLIDAVRRDMHAEEEKANTDPTWRDWHMDNVKRDRSLLDAINPKNSKRVHWQ